MRIKLAEDSKFRKFYSLEKLNKIQRTYKLRPIVLQCVRELAELKDWSATSVIEQCVLAVHCSWLESGELARLKAWKEKALPESKSELQQVEQEPVVESGKRDSKEKEDFW